MTEWDFTYGSPLRYIIEDYFEDCGEKELVFNGFFVHTLQDSFFSILIDIGEFR